MPFWNHLAKFAHNAQKEKELSQLQQKIQHLIGNNELEEATKIACIAGLLAKVAYVDFKIHPNESQHMKDSLKEWTNLKDLDIDKIVTLSIDEIKSLAGLEDHLYSHDLADIMSEKDRFNLLTSLFALAASDELVDNQESEQIRTICKGLRLQDQHFNAARATVKDFLAALKE